MQQTSPPKKSLKMNLKMRTKSLAIWKKRENVIRKPEMLDMSTRQKFDRTELRKEIWCEDKH